MLKAKTNENLLVKFNTTDPYMTLPLALVANLATRSIYLRMKRMMPTMMMTRMHYRLPAGQEPEAQDGHFRRNAPCFHS